MPLRTLSSLKSISLLLCATFLIAGCKQDMRPVRIGVTKFDLVGPQLLPKWWFLSLDLGMTVQQSLHFEVMTPRQIAVHLGTGRLSFAMVDAVEYSEIAPADNDILLATAVNQRKSTERTGVIVTKADSAIKTLADLKFKRFDYLPADDLLNVAALAELYHAGLDRNMLVKDMLLGEYHHLNSHEVAKAVVYEKASAGIMDEADYNALPEKGGTILLSLVSRDQLRILAKTRPLPGMAVLASKRANPELVAKVKDYFQKDVNKKQIAVLSWMGIQGFEASRRETYLQFNEYIKGVPLPKPSLLPSPQTKPAEKK